MGESAQEFPAPKLRSSVAVDDAAGHVTAHQGSVLECSDGQARLHPRVDRVSDDPVAEHVLDRANVELALARFVFRDIGQPELVGGVGNELVPGSPVLVGDGATVVVDRWAGLAAVAAPFFPERGPPVVGRRDPPSGLVGHRLTLVAGFVGEEPVPELGVVLVGVEQCVCAIRLHDLAGRDGIGQLPVVGLA